jgi:hypothetical protein
MTMEPMTLGQFATVVGASSRWVQNALRALALGRAYTAERAKILGLTREIHGAFGVPLVQAHQVARHALAVWPDRTVWRGDDAARVVALEVNVERYLSAYAVRLSLARNRYAERRRGRPAQRRKRGIAAAREYGVDIGLLRESLKRTPAERLRRLDQDVEFLGTLQVAEP